MNIVLGSISDQKLAIVRSALNDKIEISSLKGVSAESQISDQPLSLSETGIGARNRAKNALDMEAADLAIGLEGGLEMKDGIYFLICAAAIFDGTNNYSGESELIALPREVSSEIEQGSQFGDAIRDYKQLHPELPHEEMQIVDELINRSTSFTIAIHRAIDQMNAGFTIG